MHLVGKFEGEEAHKRAVEPKPFGPGFTIEQVGLGVKLEVWGSEFNEPGGDYCEFRLLDHLGRVILKSRVEGY